MVDKKVVVKTIKKMLSSGIEDDVIKSTLSDLGLNEEESAELLASAKGETVPEETESDETAERDEEEKQEITEPPVEEQSYDIDSVIKKTSDRIKSHLAEKEKSDELKEQSTHMKLEEQDGKLDEMHSKINSLHSKVDSSPAFMNLEKKVSSVEKDVSEIKKDLKDLKAKTSAMHDIMKKILETERKLLTKK